MAGPGALLHRACAVTALAGVAAIVLWRPIAGGIDAHAADDATMFLRIPLAIGGIYLGWFSPTEGAGTGASVIALIGLLSGRLGWLELRDSLLETAKTTAFIALIPVWFGIMCLTAVEVGMITPPFGLNLFVISAAARDVPMTETYRGVLPFVASDIVRIGILLNFPFLSLLLPGMW